MNEGLQLGEISHNEFAVEDICHLQLPVWRTVYNKYQTYLAQLAVKSINASRNFIVAWNLSDKQSQYYNYCWVNVLYSGFEKRARSA